MAAKSFAPPSPHLPGVSTQNGEQLRWRKTSILFRKASMTVSATVWFTRHRSQFMSEDRDGAFLSWATMKFRSDATVGSSGARGADTAGHIFREVGWLRTNWFCRGALGRPC